MKKGIIKTDENFISWAMPKAKPAKNKIFLDGSNKNLIK